jgi:iron complex transport system substrate-binding protein
MPHPSTRRALRALAAAALAGGALAGCGSSSSSSAVHSSTRSPATAASVASTPTTTPTTATAAGVTHYPVTIENCGSKLTFDSAPTRAVSNDINTTEDMLALGLQHSMIGTFGVDGDGPKGHPVPTQYLAAFHSVRDVSPNYFTLEPLVGLRPDFLFAGFNYGLQKGTRLTPQGLAQFGIKTLALTESCAQVQPNTPTLTINDTYQDITNLGVIFNVQKRAAALVAQMKAQIAAVQAKVSGLKPVSVFDYDSGTSAPFTAGGLATPQALIQLASGTNIFSALKQTFTSVSWEQVVARQPRCIIINDYGTPTAAQKLKFLQSFPAAKNLPAIRNHCVIVLDYDEITPSPRNAQAVLALAKVLHPTAF